VNLYNNIYILYIKMLILSMCVTGKYHFVKKHSYGIDDR